MTIDQHAMPALTTAPARNRSPLTTPLAARITFYLAFLTFWTLLSMIADRVPSPLAVVEMLWQETVDGEVVSNFLLTNSRFLVGVAIAVVLGILIGLVVGSSSLTRALFSDIVLVGLSIPAIIWAFLSTMWFGFSWEAPVTTSALATTPYIAVNVAKGLQGVSRDLRDMSAVYGVGLRRRVRELLLPAVAGYVVAGLRIGLIIGWNAVLLSEWFGGADGVGFRARYWYDGMNYAGFTAWVILFVLYVVIVDRLILMRISRRLFAWRDVNATNLKPVKKPAES
ncbi:ABC transporter permease subunit [Mycobacterium sp. 236(2023)]|uniref:ABC transporter permease n=1 Tax=Mycobacterium sp. 236(2023) TaxID=3038163 RepID=UPI0024152E87|nr:ABC transporter permease subunit [Mycobacterium sp. 236(2023)]MDG4667118.1 ABC transporter permease subunit [Mycobacterium sp. 236(2023)]